jgi:hypothetical protein
VCGYWAIVRYEWEREDSANDGEGSRSMEYWLPPAAVRFSQQLGGSLSRQYTYALHWTVVTLVGNDLKPATEVEILFSTALMLTGAGVVVPLIIGSLSSIVSDADYLANKKKEQIQSVMTYMKVLL